MMEQLSMFDYKETMSPLASRLRPESLETFVGQKHLLGEGKLLRQLIDQDQIPSMIFWGPPGVGKTTLASIIAKKTHADFVNFSAVTSGIKEIKEVMARAELSRRSGLRTLVFVDEIHRFNKAQQDAFLPYVEKAVQGPIITTFLYPDTDFDFAQMYRFIKERGYAIYPGKLTDKDTFRIGTIGEIYEEDILRLAQIMKEYMESRGN